MLGYKYPNILDPHHYPPVNMEQTECSETLAYKIQMLGNYPEEIIQHSKHGKSLKSRIISWMTEKLAYSSDANLCVSDPC